MPRKVRSGANLSEVSVERTFTKHTNQSSKAANVSKRRAGCYRCMYARADHPIPCPFCRYRVASHTSTSNAPEIPPLRVEMPGKRAASQQACVTAHLIVSLACRREQGCVVATVTPRGPQRVSGKRRARATRCVRGVAPANSPRARRARRTASTPAAAERCPFAGRSSGRRPASAPSAAVCRSSAG